MGKVVGIDLGTTNSLVAIVQGDAVQGDAPVVIRDATGDGLVPSVVSLGEDGTVYEKDLGERTTEVAAAISEYNPGDGWKSANP